MSVLLPVIPLRDISILPHQIVPLYVGREKSLEAIEQSINSHNKEILLFTQINPDEINPTEEDLYETGVLARIVDVIDLPDGPKKILVNTRNRVTLEELHELPDVYEAEFGILPTGTVDVSAERSALEKAFMEYSRLDSRLGAEVMAELTKEMGDSEYVYSIASLIDLSTEERQDLLKIDDIQELYVELLETLAKLKVNVETQQKLEKSIENSVKDSQKSFYLREQMQAIQKELAKIEGDEDASDLPDWQEYTDKMNTSNMTKEAKKLTKREIKKVKEANPMSGEVTMAKSYVEWMLDIPWHKTTKDRLDIKKAKQILDRDHFGLKDVKERILEYLAVKKLVKKGKGKPTILCLAGPPGVGKTSIAKGLAEAMNRKFVRVSLGGVNDEAEIRGHRKTYVGSMPGKIIQGMKKAGVVNPLVLLDEIDKMGTSQKGDPASALLEVLDPEQNKSFKDHFVNTEYDLSQVMFVATANYLDQVPRPLLDRMEVIHLSGYTPDEKLQIAKNYLVDRAIENNGLENYELKLSDKVLEKIITGYTKESGVRNLTRTIDTIGRKVATQVVSNKMPKGKKFNITEKKVEEHLGPVKFRHVDITKEKPKVGVVNGLAYTSVGGDLLKIEAVTTPGKGNIKFTGKLGDVMKESVQVAHSFVKSNYKKLKVTKTKLSSLDIHIHCPEGAVPKDGPSAGITMTTAIASALSGKKIRQDVAMTGEVTITGRVLAIGGLKEKFLGAKQAGVKTVIIPKENEKDLVDIPEQIKKGLKVIPVEHVNEVLKAALY